MVQQSRDVEHRACSNGCSRCVYRCDGCCSQVQTLRRHRSWKSCTSECAGKLRLLSTMLLNFISCPLPRRVYIY